MPRHEAFHRATQAVSARSGRTGSSSGDSRGHGDGSGRRDSSDSKVHGGSKRSTRSRRQQEDASLGPAVLLAASLGAPASALEHASASERQPASGAEHHALAAHEAAAAAEAVPRLGSLAATQGPAVAAYAAALRPLPFAFWPQAAHGHAGTMPLASYQQLLYNLVPGGGTALPGLVAGLHPPATCPFSLPLHLPALRLHQQPASACQAVAGPSGELPAPPACSGPSALTAAGPAAAAGLEEEQPFTSSAFLIEEPPASPPCIPAATAAPPPHAAPAAAASPKRAAAAPAAPDAPPMHPSLGPSAPLTEDGGPTVRLPQPPVLDLVHLLRSHELHAAASRAGMPASRHSRRPQLAHLGSDTHQLPVHLHLFLCMQWATAPQNKRRRSEDGSAQVSPVLTSNKGCEVQRIVTMQC